MVPDLKSKLKEAMTQGKKKKKKGKYFPKLVSFHCVKDAKMEKKKFPQYNYYNTMYNYSYIGDRKTKNPHVWVTEGTSKCGKGWTREQSFKLYFF